MGRRSEYNREEKIAAVKLVTEGGRSRLNVANEYGIHENTLGKWKRQYAINPESTFHGEPVLDEASAQERELQQLRRQVQELKDENDFLKSLRILCKEPAVKYAVIEQTAGRVSIRGACELLKARRQGYYEYQQHKGSPREVMDRLLTARIKNIFYESNRIYGARKIQEELCKDDL